MDNVFVKSGRGLSHAAIYYVPGYNKNYRLPDMEEGHMSRTHTRNSHTLIFNETDTGVTTRDLWNKVRKTDAVIVKAL